MDELISRQVLDLWNRYKPTIAVDVMEYDRELKKLLSTNLAEVGTDCISREQAIDKFIDGLEEIFANIRERHIDESVCGLCEYDGAYIGQSGDWCNECPGFDKDDCFKLSDKTRKKWTEEIIKALTPIHPVNNSENPNGSDVISRQAAIDATKKHYRAHDNDLLELIAFDIEQLPSVQPERTCVNCGRTVNNGGWYADGGTRCPIEEHYALPKDGYCHLWEKRNVTDDDYPEGRADE